MFKNKKIISLLIVALLIMSLIVGCSTETTDTGETGTEDTNTPEDTEDEVTEDTATGDKDYKIVLLLPGPINDQGWNATAYQGLQLVEKDLGVKMEYLESVQQADFEAVFTDYGEKEYDLVFAHGTQFFDAAKAVGTKISKYILYGNK